VSAAGKRPTGPGKLQYPALHIVAALCFYILLICAVGALGFSSAVTAGILLDFRDNAAALVAACWIVLAVSR